MSASSRSSSAQRTDRGERRAQLVRDRGHEVVLEPVQALQLLVGLAQLGVARSSERDLSSSARE